MKTKLWTKLKINFELLELHNQLSPWRRFTSVFYSLILMSLLYIINNIGHFKFFFPGFSIIFCTKFQAFFFYLKLQVFFYLNYQIPGFPGFVTTLKTIWLTNIFNKFRVSLAFVLNNHDFFGNYLGWCHTNIKLKICYIRCLFQLYL